MGKQLGLFWLAGFYNRRSGLGFYNRRNGLGLVVITKVMVTEVAITEVVVTDFFGRADVRSGIVTDVVIFPSGVGGNKKYI